MKRQDLGQYPTELLMTSLVCKVRLYYSSVLRRLINCSTPKTAYYIYSLEKLLWNVKFYSNQYFSQTYSHEIVRRNVKLTRENLNLDSKIKHLSPVYKKRNRKAVQTILYAILHTLIHILCSSKYATLPITLTADARSLQNLSPWNSKSVWIIDRIGIELYRIPVYRPKNTDKYRNTGIFRHQ